MDAKQKKNLKIGAGIAAVVAVLAVIFWPKKAKAAKGGGNVGLAPKMPTGTIVGPRPSKPKAGTSAKSDTTKPQSPVSPLEPDPIVDKPGSPRNPTQFPEQGKYYAVKKGDNLSKLIKKSGFQPVSVGVRIAKFHAKNQWIGRHREYGLMFYQHFKPMHGMEDVPWAWNTEAMSGSSNRYKWPVVYIPRIGEAQP